MTSRKILFIAPHRLDRAPNQRFRFEQYLTYFEQQGYRCEISNLLSEKDDRYFYLSGKWFRKIWILLKAARKRMVDVKKIRRGEFSLVFIIREAFFIGPPVFERKIAKTGVPIVFDFDDAIWLENVSENNRLFKKLKFFSKTSEIISLSIWVIAGNEYLANYARQFNTNVKVIPTTIDTSYHVPRGNHDEHYPVVIGWTGSKTTSVYLREIIEVLRNIKRRFGEKVEIYVIGDENFKDEQIEVVAVPWRRDTEIADLHRIDIGIMPLPDNEWTRGKCGLKLLQYMALEIPAVASPVGVNTEIITHGENGFLAKTHEEWERYLSMLIEDSSLRSKLGRAGRKTVEERYSVTAWKGEYLELISRLVNKNG